MLRPARRMVGRLQRRAGRPAAQLYSPNVTASDVRLFVGIAERKGDRQGVTAALLRLVQRGAANETEQRRVRSVGVGAPAPAADPPPTTDRPVGPPAEPESVADRSTQADDAVRLTLHRPDPAAPIEATVTGRPGALPYWRPAWAGLPSDLRDQLTTSVLTRLAATGGVTEVRAGDPASTSVARAVAAGTGARYGGQP
ncbi:hypothetical protein EDC02_6982 [Micromonospora sp. Llam0]|uniref:hypothetical protein n=1 Tax=Micromonospora sp. Llam0 TaxID=2485143 RepID=UPI000F469F5B|nr:hypothetical protein [Micromonospora sp. Llam0]ROO52083.1 hypothetical protein EDC02_6982 [Micromonospora sp. Llam0]